MTTDPLNGHPEVVTVGQDEGKQKFSFFILIPIDFLSTSFHFVRNHIN